MIKNWTVKSKEVKFKSKGVINMWKYLQNEEHQNHKGKTEKIINIHNPKYFVEKTLLRNERNDTLTKRKGRGGKPITNYRKSLCFSLPRDINPTEEELTKISQDLYKMICKKLGKSQNEMKELIFINRHIEEKTHINILVSNSNLNGTRNRIMKEKSFLNRLKSQFNLSVLEHLNINYKDYTPQPQPNRKRSKNQYTEKYLQKLDKENQEKQKKQTEEIQKKNDTYIKNMEKQLKEKNEQELKKRLEEQTQRFGSQEIKRINQRVEERKEQTTKQIQKELNLENEKQKKLFKNIETYKNRMEQRIQDRNQEKYNKNFEYMTKRIEKIENEERKQKMYEYNQPTFKPNGW